MHYFTTTLALYGLANIASSSSLLQTPRNSSFPTRSKLFKRTDPNIIISPDGPEDYSPWPSEAAVQKVEAAISNVIELCSYAVSLDEDGIWENYFSNEVTMAAVLNAIMGNPTDPNNPDPTGAAALGSIDIQYGASTGDCAVVNGNTPTAFMVEWDTTNPLIMVCDAGLAQPALFDIECGDIGPDISYKFSTLASTLLHEYTHWDSLTQSIVGGGGIIDQDNGYGAYNVWQLALNNPAGALQNADSYAYYTSHLFYSIICGATYDAPVPEDDDDPNCGDAPCTG